MNWKSSRRIGINCMTRPVKNSEPDFSTSTGSEDTARKGHPLLSQRVAFWWSGVLGEYRETHRGFSVVMGPKFTRTAWGLVRFKPLQLPHEMVAVPSAAGLRTLLDRHAKGERVEIGIPLHRHADSLGIHHLRLFSRRHGTRADHARGAG